MRKYKIMRRVVGYSSYPLQYAVLLKKKFWIFSWWEYLRDDEWPRTILTFIDKQDAIMMAEEIVKGREVKL